MKTQLILLRKIKSKESDLILQGISKEHGKISCLARGALRSKKRFGGGILEPTHVIEGIFQKIHSDRLSPLSEAKLVYDFPLIRKDYDKLQTAFEILEVYIHAVQENDISAQELYDLLGNTLRSLEKLKGGGLPVERGRASPSEKFFSHFAVKFLALQGVLEFEEWQKHYLKESILRHSDLPPVDLAAGQVEVTRQIVKRFGRF